MATSARAGGDSKQQADVVAFLETPGVLKLGEAVRRIDTHAAHVFLVGDRAWKLKRSVKFGYLDFSSAEKRRAALEMELELNRRSAPDLYLAVHPLCRDREGLLVLDGECKPIDWLLEMRRFPDEALLEEIAAKGGLTEPLVHLLADEIKALHDAAEPHFAERGRDRIEAVIAGNQASMARYPEVLAPNLARRVIERQLRQLRCHAGLLDARAREGRVRHGHGDLHLANIAVIEDKPVLFDCLEFSPALATIDVLYDLAFVLMDLWERGYQTQANVLFNRYLDLSPQDEGAIALLPLFLSIRATVRAHAVAAQATQAPRLDAIGKARDYLVLAHKLLASASPRLVAIGGLSGTGKSTVARRVGSIVGRPPGARILRSDVLRKRLAGVPPETPLPKDAYTETANAAVYAEMERLAHDALRGGQSVITDAVYAKSGERSAIGRLAQQQSVSFDGIWLEAAPDLLKQRIIARVNDASDADASVAEVQAHYRIGRLHWHRVDASGSPDAVALVVRAILAAKPADPKYPAHGEAE